jgi:hypothetical protein
LLEVILIGRNVGEEIKIVRFAGSNFESKNSKRRQKCYRLILIHFTLKMEAVCDPKRRYSLSQTQTTSPFKIPIIPEALMIIGR